MPYNLNRLVKSDRRTVTVAPIKIHNSAAE